MLNFFWPLKSVFLESFTPYGIPSQVPIQHADSIFPSINEYKKRFGVERLTLHSFFYDIDLALAVVKAPSGSTKGLIAYCPEAFTPDSRELLAAFDGVDKIEVSLIEAQMGFATNMVSTGQTVIMGRHAPELARALHDHGLTILSPDITELAKGGGYIRCTTLTLV